MRRDDPLERGRRFKEEVRSGALCLGAFVKMPSDDMVEVLAGTDLNFIVADAEHGPISPETCQRMARAAEASAVPLLVRLGAGETTTRTGMYLDTGVTGVHLPQISTLSAGYQATSSLCYPPVGVRGLAGARWTRYGADGNLSDRVRAVDGALTIVVHVEDLQAVANLEELLNWEQPDVFFVGPTDLAASMGLQGDRQHPRAVEVVSETVARIVAAGKVAGIMATSPDDARSWIAAGVTYVAFNAEAFVHWGARAVIDASQRPVRPATL